MNFARIMKKRFSRTLCASCKNMWDGFGLPCPRCECSSYTTECSWYSRMTDKDIMTFAPEFWNDTFDVPVRPLLSEMEKAHKQLTLF